MMSILGCSCVSAFGVSGEVAAAGPIFPPWYYDHPFYYPPPLPPPVRQRYGPPPPAQPAPAAALPSTQPTYWYCFDTKNYYPETTQCPGGWQQVIPREVPPPPSPAPPS